MQGPIAEAGVTGADTGREYSRECMQGMKEAGYACVSHRQGMLAALQQSVTCSVHARALDRSAITWARHTESWGRCGEVWEKEVKTSGGEVRKCVGVR